MTLDENKSYESGRFKVRSFLGFASESETGFQRSAVQASEMGIYSFCDNSADQVGDSQTGFSENWHSRPFQAPGVVFLFAGERTFPTSANPLRTINTNLSAASVEGTASSILVRGIQQCVAELQN